MSHSVLEGNSITVQNRAEIAKLKPIIEENRNAVAANNKTIEEMKQQIEVAKISLVDSRVEARFKICAIQRYISDTRNEMEKAQQSFNAQRDEIIEKIRLETERQKSLADRQQAIDTKTNTMKRKLTPTRQRSHRDNLLIELANTSVSRSSSSNSQIEASIFKSKRARITNKIEERKLQYTIDSDTESDNLIL